MTFSRRLKVINLGFRIPCFISHSDIRFTSIIFRFTYCECSLHYLPYPLEPLNDSYNGRKVIEIRFREKVYICGKTRKKVENCKVENRLHDKSQIESPALTPVKNIQ